MQYDTRKYQFKHKYDFEVGYLVKSPCKKCENHAKQFPKCADSCSTLDRIHASLVRCVSCTRGG